MKPTIINRKEMGLVPGSWAWMKHQLETAQITYEVGPSNVPVFKCKFEDVFSRFICFSPCIVGGTSKQLNRVDKSPFYCAALMPDGSDHSYVCKWCTSAAEDLFYNTLREWASEFEYLIE